MSDNRLRAAIYARVSSHRQADEGTISSQTEELEARVARDGLVLCEELRFVDEGYSGATLARPKLEKLRDIAAMGGVDRLYVHSPDRLARKYAYQVLLVDEFRNVRVEVVFLNHGLGTTPEEDLLLQVQGVVAEYERAKIMERSRRGKRHAALSGRVSVLGGAPYGYRYVSRNEGGGEARYEIVLDQAGVVRRIFDWVGKSRLSIGEVARRLRVEGVDSPKGKAHWDRATIWQLLRNPAYKGQAAFGKTKSGERRERVRPTKRQSEQPRRPKTFSERPTQEWIYVPVPAIVDEGIFDIVAEQLEENRKRARQHKRGARYLLQGLIVCGECGRAYCGRTKRSGRAAQNGQARRYSYYLCGGTLRGQFGGKRVCDNGNVRVDTIDDAVWNDVRSLLEDPKRIEAEFDKRLRLQQEDGPEHGEVRELRNAMQKLKRAVGRLIDAYGDGLLEKSEFEPRIRSLRERQHKLEAEIAAMSDAEDQATELRLVMSRLEEFARKVKEGLAEADWQMRREIIRTLVKQIEVETDRVRVVYRVFSGTTEGKTVSHHRCDRARADVPQDLRDTTASCSGERSPRSSSRSAGTSATRVSTRGASISHA